MPRAYQSPCSGTHCGLQCAQIPNFASGETPLLQSCLGCLLLATLAFAASALAGKDPKKATEWFQRAEDQMYLRAPGSTPFHMKVAFHALPGIVLDKEESSQIISGDGIFSGASFFSRDAQALGFRVPEATMSGQELSKSAHRVFSGSKDVKVG